MATRADQRKFHYTYKVTRQAVTSAGDLRVFYSIHSTDNLDDGFNGAGSALYESIKDYGREAHVFERLGLYSTRKEAKQALAELKANQLTNPKRPDQYAHHYVYKTTRFDGKFYIGVHSTDDLDDKYLGSGTYITRSVKKYGRDKHSREILEMCDSRELAFTREKEIVTPELLSNPLCMNMHAGGAGSAHRVYGLTENSKRLISTGLKKHYNSEAGQETKRVLSESQLGQVRSEETRLKMAEAKQGVQFSDEHREKLSNAKLGKKLSAEHRAAQSTGRKGMKQSAELRAKRSAQMKGKPRPPSVSKKLQRKCTVDGIEIFDSVQALIDALGTGKTGRRSPNFQYV